MFHLVSDIFIADFEQLNIYWDVDRTLYVIMTLRMTNESQSVLPSSGFIFMMQFSRALSYRLINSRTLMFLLMIDLNSWESFSKMSFDTIEP